jgi:hypothetical protein
MHKFFLLIVLAGVLLSRSALPDSPYPPSDSILGISFDWSSHDRRAPGSDNWPITWADNDHQYASWGDGGGFGGTNSDGRVSLGVARVEGDADDYSGINVWGGLDPENPAGFGGKSYGILCVDGVLYMWVSPGSDTNNYSEARIYESTDHGAHWSGADWAFTQSDGLILPTFLQFGRDYAGSRDDFVYVYANHLKRSDALAVQIPGEISLMRVHRSSIMDRDGYEFFTGIDGSGLALWDPDMSARAAVFENPEGVGWNTSVIYNPGLGRYFLITEHGETVSGRMGIFDAPEPWGPWTTVLYEDAFGSGAVESTTFFYNFSPRWWSRGGLDFVLVFTGIDENDSWNTVEGSFEAAPAPDPDGEPSEPVEEPAPDPADGGVDTAPDVPSDTILPDAAVDALEDEPGPGKAESSCGCGLIR